MNLLHRYLFQVLWWAWFAYWFVTSFSASRAKRVQVRWQRRAHLLAFVAAFVLLSYPSVGYGVLGTRIVPRTETLFYAGAAMTAAGLAFAVWARVHLGQHWSGNVTLKEGHRLIRSGPYALVRHPIYTGLLLAFVGSAVAVDEWRGVLAVVIVFATLVPKYRLEERWLTEEFGEEYERYKREVKALIPGVI
jgi:protein-S-isoprenylcysteine O-methyltransferase Ste14